MYVKAKMAGQGRGFRFGDFRETMNSLFLWTNLAGAPTQQQLLVRHITFKSIFMLRADMTVAARPHMNVSCPAPADRTIYRA